MQVPGRPTLIAESTVSIEPTRVTDFSTVSTMTTPNLVHEVKTDESHFQDVSSESYDEPNLPKVAEFAVCIFQGKLVAGQLAFVFF